MDDSDRNKKQEWSAPKLFSLDYNDTNGGLTTADYEDTYNFNQFS